MKKKKVEEIVSFSPLPVRGAEGNFIRLCMENDVSKVWDASLDSVVSVGRNPDSVVCINLNTVSRRQCRIFLNSAGVVVIENFSTVNPTKLNDVEVLGTARVSVGDKIRFGRTVLVVLALDVNFQNDLHNGTRFINV
jgi:pSer/pThr/pTyr-binding forkhead associated (FHA) protein